VRRALAIPLLLLAGLGCCDGPTLAGPKTVEFVRPQGASSYLFDFRAHQSASGQISGYIVSRNTPDYPAPFEVVGRVTCLRVVGNRASIGGEVQHNASEIIPEAARYRGWLFYVEDSQGQAGESDKVSEHIWVYEAPLSTCPTPDRDSATMHRNDGDVVISVNR
jgi:hypothetical protein